MAEVLDQQPPEVAWFMLDTSILGELTADACAVVAGRPDAATLLRRIDAANLFLVALDDERTSFRYHQLVRQVLRAELRARDPAREQALQLRAGEWFEATGEIRRATRHFLAARQADRALALLRDRVVADFLHNPALPAPLDVSMIDPALLASAPDRLLGLAADLLLSGEMARAVANTWTCSNASSRRSRPGRGWRPGSRWCSAFQLRGGSASWPKPSSGPGRPGHPGADAAQRRVVRRHPVDPAAGLRVPGRFRGG